MITYQTETMETAIPEMVKIFKEHWEEIALNKDKVPLDINLDKYKEYENAGALHLVTVRDGEKLVGYYVGIVSVHLHYKSTLMGFTDIYYLLKDYRKGLTGVRMFKFVEKSMAERGVKILNAGMKLHHDNSSLFRYLGWTEIERTYQKVLV
jgi:hypothetical protein